MGSIGNPTPVQLHIWCQKKPDMTREEFIDYWINVHGTATLSMPVVKKHCVKYEQFHDDPEARAAVEDAFGLPASGWDGLAILTFDSMEGAKAVYSDPAFVKFVVEDEPKFCRYPGVTQRIAVVGKPYVVFER